MGLAEDLMKKTKNRLKIVGLYSVCLSSYLGEDEREEEVEELEVAAAMSFFLLLFEDFFGLDSVSFLSSAESLELVLFDLFIFILRPGDSGCGKTVATGATAGDCKGCFSASLEAVAAISIEAPPVVGLAP